MPYPDGKTITIPSDVHDDLSEQKEQSDHDTWSDFFREEVIGSRDVEVTTDETEEDSGTESTKGDFGWSGAEE